MQRHKPITVIRIEHPDSGKGLFRSRLTNDDMREGGLLSSLIDRHQEFPTPFTDYIDMSEDDFKWFCAFKSVDQVKAWVTSDEIWYLKQLGFIVWMLDVTNYQLGEYQVCFTKESIVSKKDISSLF